MDQTEPRPLVTISLCLIAKDEEAFLARCLESARAYVDEIIVVDTGSTDRTVEIARRFGAKVFFYAWDGSFATARNVALDHATSEWILSLDADEVLEPTAGSRLREIVSEPSPRLRAYGILIRNLHDREDVELVYNSFSKRLFPRHPRIRWTRTIHKQITHLDGDGALDYVQTDEIALTHFGYLQDPWTRKGKKLRNADMLLQAIAADPTDPFNYYNMGQEHYSNRDYPTALGYFEQAIQRARGWTRIPSYLAYAYALAAGACVETRELDKGIAVGEEGASIFEYADLFCNLGSCYLLKGSYERAAHYYERAHALNRNKTIFSGDAGSVTWRPMQSLGDAYFLQGDPVRALDYFSRAIAYDPRRPYPKIRAAQASLAIGNREQAELYLREIIEMFPEHEEANLGLVDCALAAQDVKGATDHLKNLLAGHPEKPRYRVRLAEILEDTGDVNGGLSTLFGGIHYEPKSGLLYQRLATFLTRAQRFADATSAYKIALSIDSSDVRSRIGLEAARILANWDMSQPGKAVAQSPHGQRTKYARD
jgi:glycosyltransferase involved in cell wall biosynthesis